jgi:hypothetical protein
MLLIGHRKGAEMLELRKRFRAFATFPGKQITDAGAGGAVKLSAATERR